MKNKKVALITGCSSGIGYLTALMFARHGFTAFAAVRNPNSEGAKSLKELADKEQLDLQLLTIDITSESSVKKGVNFAKEKAERIDILVNNAGIMHLGPIESFSVDEIKEQFETNFYGTFRMIKEVLPLMRERKSGMIINVSSINGLLSFPLYGIYSSSKFALETMTEALRFEVVPFGIKVALVEPGTFDTNFWDNKKHPANLHGKNSSYQKLVTFLDGIEKKKQKKRSSFLNRLINPQRVANTIYKIAQQENPKLRHVVGVDANMFMFLKKVLPERLRFWALHKAYKW